jgi:DNA-directed RNA polymerase subunit RPC12/RpoP
MKTVNAQMYIDIIVTCPECGEDIDIDDIETIIPSIVRGGKYSFDSEIECHNCNARFIIGDIEY